MRKRLTMLIVALALALTAGAALAEDDCRVPIADWQPRTAVAALAQQQRWIIARIKIDDGCYELTGTDAEGHQIRVKVDPGTLDLVELRIRYRDATGRPLGPQPAPHGAADGD
jgi:hypothetical protein